MSRALAPVVGVVLLVGITVMLAAVLAVAVTGYAPSDPADPVVIEASADAETGQVRLEHVSGPPLDVRRVTVRVHVDGEPLRHQPPVPFFSATGFYSGPTGPFNPAADAAWTLGESASFAIAGTNHPPLTPGASVEVTISRDGQLVATATTTAD